MPWFAALRFALFITFGMASYQDTPVARTLNLDFEVRGYRDATSAWGWLNLTRPAPAPGAIRVDEATHHHGALSLRMHREAGAQLPLTVGYRLAAQRYSLRGKHIRFSAWMLTDSVRTGTAALRLIGSNGPGDVSHSDSALGVAAPGRHGWLRYTVEVPVDTSDTGVALILQFSGEGTVWFDDCAIDVDGNSITGEPAISELSTGEQKWIEHAATQIESADRLSPGDSRILTPLLGAARVIGLGEATHGTSEFQRLRRPILELEARHPGVTLFALEETQLKAERLNQYVLKGVGDPRAIMAEFYNMWQTEEMLNLVEWIRRFNATGPGRIEFAGVDVVDVRPPIDSVLAFLGRLDPSYAITAGRAYKDVREVWQREQFQQADSLVSKWTLAARQIVEHLEQSRSTYATRSDTNTVSWGIQNANTVIQSLLMLTPAQNKGRDIRDSCMAVNLRWYLARSGPDARAVIAAHNLHISREPQRMGWYLAAASVGYLSIGTTTYEGAYTADTSAGRPIAIRAYLPTPLYPAPPGTLDATLHSMGKPQLLLDLRSAASDSAGRKLLDPISIRLSGVTAMDWAFLKRPIARDFDLLIFVDRTHPTTLLRCPAHTICGG